MCRQIEQQQEQETADLSELWNELRHKLVHLFHVAATQPSCSGTDPATASSIPSPAVDPIHELIDRFAIALCIWYQSHITNRNPRMYLENQKAVKVFDVQLYSRNVHVEKNLSDG